MGWRCGINIYDEDEEKERGGRVRPGSLSRPVKKA